MDSYLNISTHNEAKQFLRSNLNKYLCHLDFRRDFQQKLLLHYLRTNYVITTIDTQLSTVLSTVKLRAVDWSIILDLVCPKVTVHKHQISCS